MVRDPVGEPGLDTVSSKMDKDLLLYSGDAGDKRANVASEGRTLHILKYFVFPLLCLLNRTCFASILLGDER
mgnify:FL=1